MKSQLTKQSPATEAKASSAPVIVIMGAAVWQGGRASKAMSRRVRGALASAQGYPDALFLASGGVGLHPPSEARVMAELLRQAGVAESNILIEEASTDTLSSVRNCVRLLRSIPAFGDLIICSDAYHIPRCRWLFHLYGFPSRAGQVESGRPQNRILRWMYYYVRDATALVWDTLLVLTSRYRNGSK
jgi:vancomycin permeability regulator SanA